MQTALEQLKERVVIKVKHTEEGTVLYADLSEEFLREQAIALLKDRRDRLRERIPTIKKTTARLAARKKMLRFDYCVGSMIFFNESLSDAIARTEREVKHGRL